MIGKTIFEVRRILLEHLHEIDSGDRIASGDQQLVRPVAIQLQGNTDKQSSLVPVVITR
jgi:hypothetical protein